MKKRTVVVCYSKDSQEHSALRGRPVPVALARVLGVPEKPGKYRLTVTPNPHGKFVVESTDRDYWGPDYVRVRRVGRRAEFRAVTCAADKFGAVPGDRFDARVVRAR